MQSAAWFIVLVRFFPLPFPSPEASVGFWFGSTAVVVFPSHPRVSIRDAQNSHMWPAQPMCDQLPLVAPPLPSQSQNEQGDGRIRIPPCPHARVSPLHSQKWPPCALLIAQIQGCFLGFTKSKLSKKSSAHTHGFRCGSSFICIS